MREVQGDEHLDTQTHMYNLGSAAWHCNKLEEAIDLLKECAELRAKVLGDEHDSTIRAKKRLNDILEDQVSHATMET